MVTTMAVETKPIEWQSIIAGLIGPGMLMPALSMRSTYWLLSGSMGESLKYGGMVLSPWFITLGMDVLDSKSVESPFSNSRLS